MNDVFVVGVGMTRFTRHLERSLHELSAEALDAALTDADCERADLESAFYSGATNGYLQGQDLIPGQVIFSKIGIEGIPVFNIENACVSGTSAFHLAIQSIKSGSCDIALALGAEKMNVPDRERMFGVYDTGWDVTTPDENLATLLKPAEGFEVPDGHESDKPYSVFMSVYAAMCRQHMQKYGTTQRQLAAVSAKNHNHSVHNPLARFQQPFTIDEVLAAPAITYPLTLPMCGPISDGAAAVILASEDGIRQAGADRARAVRVLSSVMRSASSRPADKPELHCEVLAAAKAYEQAGVGPDDIDVVELHDATAMGEILHAENLGLVPFGEAGPAAERGDFSVGGRIPINPSGGIESKGHPIGATGLAQIHELVTQLRDEAGARQVDGARLALQQNSGGQIGLEEAAVAVSIFSRN